MDHGKSTLVRALTGRDPDRWDEEKSRGLTIDLGFAWATLGAHEVSFVDVPGHEHFIKNMLAGIEAIDVAMLVVAADEGWMPQSEEHLAVLDLLDTDRALVALTKIDRVDDELMELAQLEIAEQLEGTSLQGAVIVPVSAHTGAGLDDLRTALEGLLGTVPAVNGERPRLWIDRSFSITGAGTVVTGTLLDGSLAIGEHVTIWPGERSGRIRSIQSHEQDVAATGPRRRVALNLSGVERGDIARGAMIGRPGQWRTTDRISVLARPARYVDAITDRGAYHLHIGSGAWPVRIRMLADDHAVIELPEPLPLAMGDRFVLRETGRRLVVGGGRIVDPSPPRRGRDMRRHFESLRTSLGGAADDRAAALLVARGISPISHIAADSGGGTPTNGREVSGHFVTSGHIESVARAAVGIVDAFHRANPLRPGIPAASLATTLDAPVDLVVAAVAATTDLTIDGTMVRNVAFVVTRADRDAEWAAARSLLEQSGPAVPRIAELGIDRELLHALVRDGELVKISDEFVFLPSHVEQIVDRLTGMPDGFTVSDFKDRTGLSRKYAVPFLEWADRTGVTIRMGDTRRLR